MFKLVWNRTMKSFLFSYLVFCVWFLINLVINLQIVLSALVALAAAKPSLIGAPLIADPWAAQLTAPIAVPSIAKVGSVVSSIPTGVSAHSSSVVHSTGAVVTPVLTPIQKTIVHSAPLVSAPIVKHISPLAYSSPLVSSPLAYSAPIAYNGWNNGWNNGWSNGWNSPLVSSW